ncbi:uncharacterized protein TRAVEDRAFT_43543 [Trametes versicolor FP-101664 SS1]|uniref:uncharacterized protein n=1 Tax=Trametes versicolor (strain FP-101664) TaxID=717944 RepID=UPI00046223EA|nr:uncharacterized protein TRAVEDRAFT_43543 [Trametes versicolor FP-101664 SS1]EIW63239.1 hypothetical protein TRAVEDRAFT_43543 [Trametes versicolor FP-101664 SS1]
MDTNAPLPTPATPFDASDADIILHSSDSVDFHVYKLILGMVSPIFKAMFTLPDPPDPAPSSPQVVPLTENACTLRHLLHLCYPFPRTPIANLDELVATVEAMKKYEMTAPRSSLEQDLKAILTAGADPLRIYGIAYLYRFDSVLYEAAKLTLDNPRYLQARTMPPEFVHLSAAALFALMEYRFECVEAAGEVIKDDDWMVNGEHAKKMLLWPTGKPILGKSWAWIACREAGDPSCTMTAGGHELSVKTWYGWYKEDAAKALLDQPKGETVTRIPVLTRALEGAGLCPRCAPTAWRDMLDYSRLLAGRIDEAVSNVQLQLPS